MFSYIMGIKIYNFNVLRVKGFKLVRWNFLYLVREGFIDGWLYRVWIFKCMKRDFIVLFFLL